MWPKCKSALPASRRRAVCAWQEAHQTTGAMATVAFREAEASGQKEGHRTGKREEESKRGKRERERARSCSRGSGKA